MSPAVSTATASAAPAIAPNDLRNVILVNTRQAGKSSSADSSSSGSTVRNPTPTSSTTHGNAAIACTTAAPNQPTSNGVVPIACDLPMLPNAPIHAVACNG